jgi:hypothetical protein
MPSSVTPRGYKFRRMIFDAASEGTHVILGMLIVGLIFLSVIVLGELSAWAGHRRSERRRARRQY